MDNLRNFLVGTFGALTAIFAPKLAALLEKESGQNFREIIDITYIIVGLIFGVAIGVAIMFIYYNKHEHPKTVLMFAVGFPALISSAYVAKDQQSQINQIKNASVAIHQQVAPKIDGLHSK